MKLVKTWGLAMLLFVFVLESCKKGEDDPFLSLRSRKSRVAGEWKLKKGLLTVQSEKAGASTHEIYEYADDKLNYTNQTQGSRADGILHQLKLSFDKKGKFRLDEDVAGTVTELSGEWDFEKGTGEGKNKENINMTIRVVAKGKINYIDGFNKSQSNFTYRIKELRHKKMVLVTERQLIGDYAKDGVKIWVESEYEFEQ